MSERHRERLDVHRELDDPNEVAENADGPIEFEDGWVEELEVWNFLNVKPAYQYRGGNPTKETFTESFTIHCGGTPGMEPDFITKWVATELWHDLNLTIETLNEEFGIEVIDIEADEVHLL